MWLKVVEACLNVVDNGGIFDVVLTTLLSRYFQHHSPLQQLFNHHSTSRRIHLLIIFLVLSRRNMLEPLLVLQIPIDCFRKALLER